MGKGILMERDGGRAVVMTPQGEFKRVSVPRGAWDIGDEIEFADTRPAAPWARWGLVAAAAAVFALAPLGYQSWALAQPVAMVTIDINPSVELTINKRDEVLTAKALNADGELVMEGVDWKRQPVDEVVASVTAHAVELGKLDPTSETGAVVVAVAPAKDKELPEQVADRISGKAKVSVENTLETKAKAKGQEKKASSAVLEATVEETQEAEELGLTPGKLMLLEDLQATVPDVKPEQLIKQGPGSLLKDLGIKPSEVFGKSEEKHGGNGSKNEDKGKDKNKGGKSDDRPTMGSHGEKQDDKDKSTEQGTQPSDKDKPSDSRPDDDKKSGSDKKDEPNRSSDDADDNDTNDKQGFIPRVTLPGVGASVKEKPVSNDKDDKGSDKAKSQPDENGKPDAKGADQAKTDDSKGQDKNKDKGER